MTPIWITSYCLTNGIIKSEIDGMGGNYDGYVKAKGYPYSYFKIGIAAFFNEHDAIQNAEQKRIKKIESLRKQIDKLEKLKFED